MPDATPQHVQTISEAFGQSQAFLDRDLASKTEQRARADAVFEKAVVHARKAGRDPFRVHADLRKIAWYGALVRWTDATFASVIEAYVQNPPGTDYGPNQP